MTVKPPDYVWSSAIECGCGKRYQLAHHPMVPDPGLIAGLGIQGICSACTEKRGLGPNSYEREAA